MFIDFDGSSKDLNDLIASVSGTTLQIDIMQNDAYNNPQFGSEIPGGKDAFLYYKYFLDIFPKDNIDRGAYVREVGSLLQGLWKQGLKAVAASDFENELPQNQNIGL